MKTKSIKVNSKTFQSFLFVRARSNAYSKRLAELRESLGLPEVNGKIKGEHILTGDDGQPIGKFTVSRRKQYVVKANWRGNIS